jgi:hypothetical protein
MSAKLAIQSTLAPMAARAPRWEDFALDQPAGAADADRERGDEEREADHLQHGLRYPLGSHGLIEAVNAYGQPKSLNPRSRPWV